LTARDDSWRTRGWARRRETRTGGSASSAALEDYYEIGPRWRNHYLAASMFNLKGASDPDNNLIERTRAALARG
jgi:hypothetical protein